MGRFGEGGVHGRDEVGLWLWGRGRCVGESRGSVGLWREVWRARLEQVRPGLRGREEDSVTAFRAAALEEA